MVLEKMLVVNIGIQGINRHMLHPDGTREEKIFPPNVPVSCSVQMGTYLLKKYADPIMAIHFQRADGENLNHVVKNESGISPAEIDEDKEIKGYEVANPKPPAAGVPMQLKGKRGRPAGGKNK